MGEKPDKVLYENQDEVWSEAKEFLVDLVSGEKGVKEAIVWASLAEGRFGLYEHEHRGREGSDVDLVVIINEEHPLPKTWSFTNVRKDVFDLYHIGKFTHEGHDHEIDGLLVFPSRHDLQEVRNMLANKSKSIYLKSGESILDKYNYSSSK